MTKKIEEMKKDPDIEKEQRGTFMTLMHHIEMRGLLPTVEALGYEQEVESLVQNYSKQRHDEYYEKIYARNRAIHRQIGLYNDRDDAGISR